MKISSMIFVLLTFLAISCATKKVNPLQYQESKLTFGSGGGFAGTVKSFALLDNGQLFQLKNMDKEYLSIDRIDRNQVTQIMQNFKMFKFDELELNSPDNMYYFIEYSSGDENNRIVWSDKENNKNLKLLHKILMNLVPKN